MKPTWILVADSSRARIFSADTPSAPLKEINSLAHPEGRVHEQNLTSDLPGHHSDTTGAGRHGFQDETEPKEQEVIDFAKHIAKHLEQARSTNKFKQLLIVAAPAFLGTLRSELSDQTRKMVSIELDKNLTQQKPEDIRSHLPEYLPNMT
jgi:protein required for attachment to host cells